MKSKPILLIILSLLLTLSAVSIVTAEGPAAPEGVNMFDVSPADAIPGAPVTVSFDMELNAGSNGATSICLNIPVDNGTALVEAPATFDVTYGLGSTATFVQGGACFGGSTESSAFYTATGLPNGGMVYSGGFVATMNDSIANGDYIWKLTVYESAGNSRSSAQQQQGVSSPTAITLGSTVNSTDGSLPIVLGFVMIVMSISTLFLLKRRFDTQ